MKKRRNLNEIDILSVQNPVAKYAHRFNKAQAFADKSKYRRKAKHANQEAFPIAPSERLEMLLVTASLTLYADTDCSASDAL